MKARPCLSLCLCLMLLALFAVGCVSRAERNLLGMTQLQMNMTTDEVVQIMGPPAMTEAYLVDDTPQLFYFYLTRDIPDAGLRRGDVPGPQNYTPLLFEGGRLKGWGASLYNALNTLRPWPAGSGRGGGPTQ